jgi:uncharacterized protein YbjT (DUF2867 family)
MIGTTSRKSLPKPSQDPQLPGNCADHGLNRAHPRSGHRDASRDDDDPLETDHRAAHRAIEASGLEWTHVFPGEFMANTFEWIGSIRAENVVVPRSAAGAAR